MAFIVASSRPATVADATLVSDAAASSKSKSTKLQVCCAAASTRQAAVQARVLHLIALSGGNFGGRLEGGSSCELPLVPEVPAMWLELQVL
jgi:hypothetical protein